MKLIDTIYIDNLIDTLDLYGIFQAIERKSQLPFLNGDLAIQLDTDYYLKHSGNKSISLLYERLINIYAKNGQLSENEKYHEVFNNLAQIIINRYGNNWLKVYNAYFETDYKPLDNYSMVETENGKDTSSGKTSTNSSITSSTSGTNENAFYGFGQPNVPVNDTEGTTTTTTTGTGSKDDNFTENDSTLTRERTLTRSGNIGVTTSQQMLQSEIELRKFDFYEMLFNDVDKILCSKIYTF